MPKPHEDFLLGEEVMHEHGVDDISDIGTNFLKLDQTTPQQIINGAPIFTQGLVIKAGERIYFDG
jgi:hypothetical protein